MQAKSMLCPHLFKMLKGLLQIINLSCLFLKKKSLQINQSVCNLSDVLSSISTSTKTQEDTMHALDHFQKESEHFAAEVQKVDMDVADIVNQRKNDFYDQYNYLKPDSEKNGWEKFCRRL